MDYLYFRKKFTWTDEDSLISWYNHLRWGVLHEQQFQVSYEKVGQGSLRSYTAIGDVVALFVVLPIFVRYVQLHDMSIAVFAVLFQVIVKAILRPEYHAALEHKTLDHCITPQAAKSLIYFFAEDKSAIYATAIFAIFSHNTQSLRSQMTKLVGQGRLGTRDGQNSN